ncbi:TetR family transcriptional regulator [Modestobacter versicolor]|uniref:AcrR family transcriptional regulator n=1 Tax=Modestobacter versicolor TaxID=429133 RepID=A0A839Y2R0_9ACTN|nr:TetR family transcriptional regulator [Modestobacter versicolor]MBB3677019.1 AcrR family transcriptional regulator [Modestobacter versicolor]
MSEATAGRRELRKARTRAEVRETAQRLFAERGFDAVTIADVAAAADVAVQTVFNHFETKEALFFDGRTPWVEGAAASVTERASGSDPVAALRRYLEADLTQLLVAESRPENRSYLEALHRTTALQSRERMLVEQAGEKVAAVLGVAIADGAWPAAPAADLATAQLLSRMIADLFLVAGRVLVLENRRLVLAPEPDERRRLSVQATTAATLSELEQCMRGLAAQLLGQPG